MDVREPALAGIGVLVTRAAHQAEHLAQLIEADGGVAIRFPTIEIADPPDRARLLDIVDRLAGVDLAIFISPNAVAKGIGLIRSRGQTLPARTMIAGVGGGTARELKRLGLENVIAPSPFNSEALLALPELANVSGKRVVIFRGVGGRELLAETLVARGARVEYAECYRRVRPEADTGPLLQRWARGEIDVVSVTSTEGLRNLGRMLGASGKPRLIKTQAVVVSAAQAAICRELGLTLEPIVTRAPSDEAILEAIRTWRLLRTSL